MKTAVERAAERWGMKEVEKKRAAAEETSVNTQGRDAIADLTAWGERPGVKESAGLSESHDIEDPLSST